MVGGDSARMRGWRGLDDGKQEQEQQQPAGGINMKREARVVASTASENLTQTPSCLPCALEGLSACPRCRPGGAEWSIVHAQAGVIIVSRELSTSGLKAGAAGGASGSCNDYKGSRAATLMLYHHA